MPGRGAIDGRPMMMKNESGTSSARRGPSRRRPGRVALRGAAVLCAVALPLAAGPLRAADSPAPGSTAAILAASRDSDWRQPDPENLVYLDLAPAPGAPGSSPGTNAARRVIIELAPQFAPAHAANIRALVRAGWFDGLAVDRVQDNYVTQWGDADATRPLPPGTAAGLAPEFVRRGAVPAFTPLPDPDTYAPQAGYVDGFPAARDPARRESWLVHCYGMVGAGRDLALDSGNGGELYAVIGQAPRHLDRNITLVGRVLKGMALLSALPRGTGPLGFYETAGERLPIVHAVLAADLPASERDPVSVLRTDTPTWAAYVQARRHRVESFFPVAADHVDVCNTLPPVRP